MQNNLNKQQLKELLAKYKNGRCTPREVRQLFHTIKSSDADEPLEDELNQTFQELFESEYTRKVNPAKVFRLPSIRKISIAAAVLVAVMAGLYFYLQTQKNGPVKNELAIKHEIITPGHSQAVLTTDNGKQFLLDSTKSGRITILSGTVISMDDQGALTYSAGNTTEAKKVVYNTVSIPTGGFFKIELPDGSKVWLNSESELTFPSRFINGERKVTLKGEGYFEITKNKDKPFKVSLGNDEEISVLGTVFNVMAYENEPVQKISLLEGSIQLSGAAKKITLSPGEQAIISHGIMDTKKVVSMEHEVAWKNGLFDFQNDDLSHILRQIARWYNVEIEHPASSNGGHYTGSIRKSSSINEVLKMLELAGDVNFSIVGKKIIVNEKK